ncbi:MAG: hypothetical protein AAB427_03820 [Chloroflexota bacterium]
MKRKSKPRWEQQALSLRTDHTWKAPPGYKVFVADRGAVRFHFPDSWVVVPASDSIELYNKQPPEDDCRLAVSYLRLPPLDWKELPLAELITAALKDDRRKLLFRSDIREAPREGLEIAWIEVRFLDAHEQREACSRLAIARGWNLQALITFDCWVEDQLSLEPVWEEVLRSVELGRYVDDPTAGDTVQ